MDQELIRRIMMYILVGGLAVPITIGSIGPKRIFSLFRKDLEPPRLELRLTEEEQNYSPDKYAVFISGSGAWYHNGRRHWNSIVHAYNTLLEVGFKKENMYVLFYDGKNKDELDIVDAPAKKSYLKKLFEHLGGKIGSKDKLLVGVIGHGHRIGNEGIIDLEESILEMDSIWESDSIDQYNLRESQFKRMVNQLHPEYRIFVFNQCAGGEFTELGKGSSVVLSACEPTKKHESTKGSWETYFFDLFFEAIGQDKTVSIEDAFEYAKSNDPYTKRGRQRPVLITDLDPSKINLD